MIYVTHDQIEAMTLADKIAVMRDGRIEQVGSPMELYNNPANRFVANFLGLTAMNFLHRSVPDLPAGQTIGIRPEHLRLDDTGVISGKVTHVERLGGDTNLLVTTEQGETLRLDDTGVISGKVTPRWRHEPAGNDRTGRDTDGTALRPGSDCGR